MRYAIDMGHTLTGLGTGALKIVKETDINRLVGKKLIQHLQDLGHTVINCTVDKSNQDLTDRTNLINKSNADLLVSIHLNAGGGRGTETYIYNGYSQHKEESRAIAKKVNTAVVKSCNFVDRGVKEANFHVLRETTKMKGILVELFFVDSQEDCGKYDVDKIAKAMAEALTGTTIKDVQNEPIVNTSIKVGSKVKITGVKYANVDKAIPSWVKQNVYEVQKISGNMALIKDINSWVLIKDLVLSTTPTPAPVVKKEVKYLFLKAHVTKWNVYPLNKQPVLGNQVGAVLPKTYGGLEYQILGNPQTDVYTIQTVSYGKVNIYVPKDNDSKFYSKFI